MDRKIILPIILLSAISMFIIPTYAKPAASEQPFFMVLPNRQYGISVNVVFSDNYNSPFVVVGVATEEMWYIIEVGIGERAGIVFTEPTSLGYEAEPNTPYIVMVAVLLDNLELLGAVSIQTNEYGTVSSPIKADLSPYPN